MLPHVDQSNILRLPIRSTKNTGGNVMITLMTVTPREMYDAASGSACDRIPVL